MVNKSLQFADPLPALVALPCLVVRFSNKRGSNHELAWLNHRSGSGLIHDAGVVKTSRLSTCCCAKFQPFWRGFSVVKTTKSESLKTYRMLFIALIRSMFIQVDK